MSYWARVWQGITGQAKKRIPGQMELLGAPSALVQKARKASHEQQEALFLEFAEGRHAIALDWKATNEDVLEGLLPLLSDDEKRLLPSLADLPGDSAGAVKTIDASLADGPRALVHTETLGDFSIVVLVPRTKASAFLECAGPWVIS